jgi:uncharacterized phage protein gp47/JayE
MSQIRRYDEIMESAMANMIAKQDKITDFNEGSVIHTFLDTIARLVERAYVAIRQGYNEQMAILPYSPFGMTKKSGLYASGTVVFSRESALTTETVIPKGTVVSGNGLSFTTTEAGTIAADAKDSDEINVTAAAAGSDYNIAASIINGIDSIVPADVVTVTNNSAFTGGTDEETDADFEARFTNYINGLSGTNSYAIKNAALSVNAVRSVSIQNHKPPYKDIYNMTVYVDDGSGGASETTLDAVKLAVEGDGTATNQGHIAPGINIRVIAPTVVPVNVAMNIDVKNVDSEDAETEITEIITSYVNGKTIGEEVVLSELITKVMALNYVTDCTITNPTANVVPDINQIARIGTCTLTITETE